MGTQLQKSPERGVEVDYITSAAEKWGKEKVRLLRDTIARDLTIPELGLFLQVASVSGLDPFSRQIYAVKRWDKKLGKEVMTIQTGIDGFRAIAERTGTYKGQRGPWFWDGVTYEKVKAALRDDDGSIIVDKTGKPTLIAIDKEKWLEVWPGSSPPFAAKIEIMRSTLTQPMVAVARWSEYAQTYKDGNPLALWASHPTVMLAKCAESLAMRKAFPRELSGLYTPDEMGTPEPARIVATDNADASSSMTETRARVVSAISGDGDLGSDDDVVDAEFAEPDEGQRDDGYNNAAKEKEPAVAPRASKGASSTKVLLSYASVIDSCETVDEVDEAGTAWWDRIEALPRGAEYAMAYARVKRASLAQVEASDDDLDKAGAIVGMQAKMAR